LDFNKSPEVGIAPSLNYQMLDLPDIPGLESDYQVKTLFVIQIFGYY